MDATKPYEFIGFGARPKRGRTTPGRRESGAPNHINLYGSVTSRAPNPNKLYGSVTSKSPNPLKLHGSPGPGEAETNEVRSEGIRGYRGQPPGPGEACQRKLAGILLEFPTRRHWSDIARPPFRARPLVTGTGGTPRYRSLTDAP